MICETNTLRMDCAAQFRQTFVEKQQSLTVVERLADCGGGCDSCSHRHLAPMFGHEISPEQREQDSPHFFPQDVRGVGQRVFAALVGDTGETDAVDAERAGRKNEGERSDAHQVQMTDAGGGDFGAGGEGGAEQVRVQRQGRGRLARKAERQTKFFEISLLTGGGG
jgi:hypothetical protein